MSGNNFHYKTETTTPVKTTKNGYEIRTDIITQAREIAHFEFNQKLKVWEEGDKTSERPSIPGVQEVLAIANTLYDFVNQNRK
jgi:hypothetical protein